MSRSIVLLLLVAASASARDCANWSSTMPPPVAYPGISVGTLRVVGDLLVSLESATITVYQLSADHHVEPVGQVNYPGSIANARVIHGELYLALGDHGVVHVELSDPANPTIETVFDPVPRVRDVTAFDKGFAVAAENVLYAIDRLDGNSPEILAAVAIDAVEVISVGAYVYAGGTRLSIVDFADPAQPIVEPGDSHYPGQNPSLQSLLTRMIVHENMLYVAADYYAIYQASETYMFAFDISNPMQPELAIYWQDERYGAGDPIIFGDYLVRDSHYASQEFIRLSDFQPVVRVAVGAIVGNPVAYGDHLYMRATHSDNLHRLDCSHIEVVNPIAEHRYNYQPLRCGRFGFASRLVWSQGYMHSYVDSVGFFVYDQSDPINPTIVHSEMSNVYYPSSQCSYQLGVPVYNQNWFVVQYRVGCEGYSYEYSEVFGVGSWESIPISVQNLKGAILDGNTLWIRDGAELLTYELAPFAAQLLDVVAIPVGGGSQGRLDLGGNIYLSVGDAMLVYDRSSPGAITLLEIRSLAPLTHLEQAGRIDNDLLYCLVPGGFAVIDLEPDTPTSPVVRSHVAHLVGSFAGLAWNGNQAMIYGRSGYQVVDASHADAIEVVTGLVPLDVIGAVWTGDHLYACHPRSTYLYDTSNPSMPVWLGQGQGEITYDRPCVLEGYLMMGNSVFAQNCSDVIAVENNQFEPRDDVILPQRVVLHAAAPNPFNPVTTVSFTLPWRQHVDLAVFDVGGQRRVQLLSRDCEAGTHHFTWKGLDRDEKPLPSGTYLIRLRTETDQRTQKVTLVR